jgi:hypothetical protein
MKALWIHYPNTIIHRNGRVIGGTERFRVHPDFFGGPEYTSCPARIVDPLLGDVGSAIRPVYKVQIDES